MNEGLNGATVQKRSTRSFRPMSVAGGVALASVFALAISLDALGRRERGDAESSVARCDRLARVIGDWISAEGIDSRSVLWRRARNDAFRNCMDDPDAYERFVAIP
jgi:hypothetical protein